MGGGPDLKWPAVFPHHPGEMKNPPHLSNDADQYIPQNTSETEARGRKCIQEKLRYVQEKR